MYRVRNAYYRGVPIGFNGFADKLDKDLIPSGPLFRQGEQGGVRSEEINGGSELA